MALYDGTTTGFRSFDGTHPESLLTQAWTATERLYEIDSDGTQAPDLPIELAASPVVVQQFTSRAFILLAATQTFTSRARIQQTETGDFTSRARIQNVILAEFASRANIIQSIRIITPFTSQARIERNEASSFESRARIQRTEASEFTSQARIQSGGLA